MNFLEKSSCPNITYAVHQCSRFMAHPKKLHGEAVKCIARYLLDSRDKGIIIKPERTIGLECYIDANFCRDWNREIAAEDPDTARSRHGFVMKIAGVPIFWSSKLQQQHALSTTESEYIELSHAAHYVKDTIYLLREIQRKVEPIPTVAHTYCKIFEDNEAALTMAAKPKM